MKEQNYKVVEKFVSINGEGQNAGKIAAFIRFAGCNLRCSYCDTMWANEEQVEFEKMTASQIVDYIAQSTVQYVTLTGGEPLYRDGIEELVVKLLEIKDLTIEFETNGSVSIRKLAKLRKELDVKNRIQFTMDYKLPSSGMCSRMLIENFEDLESYDTVKFVAGSIEDLQHMHKVITEYQLGGRCALYLSPVFGKIKPEKMVAYMIEHHLNDVTMQLQMHKFIWEPEKRGV